MSGCQAAPVTAAELSGGCYWMLGALGGRATAAELREEMAAAGDEYTPAQVKGGLKTLAARGLAERAVPGRAGYDRPTVWGITAHGRAMAGAWCPDAPEAVPCGLGWPP